MIFICCLVVFCVIIAITSFIFITQENYANIDFSEKKVGKSVIPLHIYMTWHLKDVPPFMKKNLEKLKKQNPEFTFHLYDEEDCRNFIRKNFDSTVLKCYDTLIPKAYKADLWRYCILYKKGGIYIDVKLEPIKNFKFIEVTDKEYLVLDRPYDNINYPSQYDIEFVNSSNYISTISKIKNGTWWKDYIGLYNALIIVKPKNTLMKQCIDKVCENVKNNEYGYNPLYPTGPGMMGELYFSKNYIEKLKSMELFNTREGTHIISKQKPILRHYKNYRKEQSQERHHGNLWKKKKIYLNK